MRKIKFICITICILSNSLSKADTCVGKFLNPINDVCWSCLFPLTIGSFEVMRSSKFKDTDNPSLPVCLCNKGGIPTPGISLGIWEPIRILEVTRTPFCLVSLGGVKIKESLDMGSFKKSKTEGDKSSKAYYHIHYYSYPILNILNLLLDFGCLSVGSFDLAYLSEFDPSHKHEPIANFMHPEVFLFANPIAVSACAADCIAATANKQALDSLFWCAGCQGIIYPFTGSVTNHTGGVATSSLLAARQLAKLHRAGLARRTATNSSEVNGELCDSSYAYRIPKTQYRLQMSFPRTNVKGEYSCNPIGILDSTFSSGREFPNSGEDFAYLIWRKRNCCFL